jgi:hypothetical protein
MIETRNVWLFVIPRNEGSVDCTIKNVTNSSAAATMLNRITKRTRVRRNESFMTTLQLSKSLIDYTNYFPNNLKFFFLRFL